MKHNKKPKAILHGECIVFESKIPASAKPERVKGPYAIIANSEVTGNHHVIDMAPSVKFFRDGARRFFKSDVPVAVRCLLKERHDAIELPSGEYEVGIQQEYDYFAQAKRNVAD